MDRRVVAQLFDCIDDVKSAMRVSSVEGEGLGDGDATAVKHVILLAASNR